MTDEKTDYLEETDIVTYEAADGIAWIAMNRPKYNNAQNGRMTYELDAAFMRAVADDEVKVIVLKGEGKHFSAGHDIGTPGRDVHLSQERVTSWYDHANKPGGEYLYVRETEAYLGMCRRWRDIPKPTIAAVQGACIAGGAQGLGPVEAQGAGVRLEPDAFQRQRCARKRQRADYPPARRPHQFNEQGQRAVAHGSPLVVTR